MKKLSTILRLIREYGPTVYLILQIAHVILLLVNEAVFYAWSRRTTIAGFS